MKIIKSMISALLFCAIPSVFAGPAINQFELKDLESEPGSIEFQSQNAHSFGQPQRKFSEGAPDEFIFDDNSVIKQRHALELEFGVTDYFRTRVGIEYEKERIEEPDTLVEADAFGRLKLEEIAVEGVLVFKPVIEGGIGLGMLAEYQHPTESDEPKSIVFGPILETRKDRWSAVANLTLIHFFGGSANERDEKWDFAYAWQLQYAATDNLEIALEAYGTIDRLGDTGSPEEERELFGDHNQHRVGPIFYYAFQSNGTDKNMKKSEGDDIARPEVVLGTGLFFGLNNNTPDVTLKWSIEAEF